MPSLDELCRALYDRTSELWITDSHEHLQPEEDRLSLEVDAVSLFEGYPSADLMIAGMSEDEYAVVFDRQVDLEKRWSILKKYLPLIRNTSYVRTALLGVRELYGFDDITDENYKFSFYHSTYNEHKYLLFSPNKHK